MRIFIIGYMGAGKSAIGRSVAKSLNLNFYDLDTEIENRYHLSIESIFKRFDENCFRNLETQALKKIIEEDNILLSCGGGTPCFNNNIQTIKEHGCCIYIKLPPKALLSRITNSKKKRPLVENKTPEELLEYITRNLEEREKFYNQADITIEGLNLNKNELVKTISEYITKQGIQ